MLGWLGSGVACRLFGHHFGRNFLRTAITRLQTRWKVKERGWDYSLLPPLVYKSQRRLWSKSQDQHAITVAIKAIAFLYGMAVRLEY